MVDVLAVSCFGDSGSDLYLRIRRKYEQQKDSVV